MTEVDQFFSEINKGREGKSWGYSTGLTKLDKLTDGVVKSNYIVLFALSGVGKSTVALYTYVYKPIMDHLDDDKYEILFFNLEMKKEFILAKLMSIHLYETYGIRISAKQLLSREMNFRLSDYVYQKVLECKEWLNKVCKILHFKECVLTSKSFYYHVINFLKERGTFVDEAHPSQGYTPHNPEKIVNVIIDHLNLTRPTTGVSKKSEIDGISDWCVKLRNWTNTSFVAIMQANRTGTAMDRLKQGYNEPRVEDIMDTSIPGFDAETVLAVYNPTKDKLSSYRGYDIKQMDGKCRSIICLKNRYGESDAADCLYFDGLTGVLKELPSPDKILDYTNIFGATKEEKQEDDNINNLTFTL